MMMKIRLYSVNQYTGEERFERECWLQDLYPELGDEYEEQSLQLAKAGRVYIGGGASQLFLAHKVAP